MMTKPIIQEAREFVSDAIAGHLASDNAVYIVNSLLEEIEKRDRVIENLNAVDKAVKAFYNKEGSSYKNLSDLIEVLGELGESDE
jgi:RecG-like helicase